MKGRLCLVVIALLAACSTQSHAATRPPQSSAGFVVCGEYEPGDQEEPRIVSDDTGGMYIAWSDYRSGSWDVYAQRVDGARNPYWAEPGYPIMSGLQDMRLVEIVKDGFGGTIIISTVENNQIVLQRIDPAGMPLWNKDGVQIIDKHDLRNVSAVADGEGGVIVSWEDGTTDDIYAKKLDAQGNEMWEAGDYPAFWGPSCGNHSTVYDGSGGVLIVAQFVDEGELRMQRVYASGAKWNPDGVEFCSDLTTPGISLAITSDGAGGAYVAWEFRSKIILTRHVDAGGNPQEEVTIYSESFFSADQLDIIADGAGNTIICWRGLELEGPRVYAQKIDPFGSKLWTEGGVAVCTEPGEQEKPQFIHSSGPNVVVSWCHFPDDGGEHHIRAQALNTSGAAAWAAEGVAVLDGHTYYSTDYDIATDGAGGLLATTYDDRNYGSENDIYAQMINSLGDFYAAEPVIVSVTDVPNDQGGWVRLTIGRSDRDDIAVFEQPAARYDVWQRIDSPSAETAPQTTTFFEKDGKCYVTAAKAAVIPPGTWEQFGSFAAVQEDEYIFCAPTRADSALTNEPDHIYFVSAHTTDPAVWFASQPDTGYSVDNLAPGVPTSCIAVYLAGGVILDWDDAPETDFRIYRVYRGSDSDFIPWGGNMVYETVTSAWTDPTASPWGYHYKITALDYVGNESEPGSPRSVSGVNGGVPAATALLDAVPNPFNPATKLSFTLVDAGRVRLEVYDVAGRLVASPMDEHREAGRHHVTWEGRDDAGRQLASGVYFYRLTAGSYTETKRMVLVK